MKGMLRRMWVGLLVAGLAIPGVALATTGYFKFGYGSKARGMGGVGIALPQDSVAAATNPAGMAFVGTRADAGLELFSPLRDGSVDVTPLFQSMAPATPDGAFAQTDSSGATVFAIPHGGFAMEVNDQISLGFSIYANGGMNTRYSTNLFHQSFAPLLGAFMLPAATENVGTLGVNLAQVILAPTATYKFDTGGAMGVHAIGVSPMIGYQTFRAYGLGDFAGFSSDPTKLTNNGNDNSFGAGVRVGWMGHFLDGRVSIGATWASKVYMKKFDKYEGLFAENGAFDIPENYGIGIALRPIDRLTVAFDVTQILYGNVKSIANSGPTVPELFGPFFGGPVSRPLGTDNGFGFGWNDTMVYKVGASFDVNPKWTVRAGYVHNDAPIPRSENLFNVLAPGVVQDHITVGFTWKPAKNRELTVGMMHALNEERSFFFDAAGLPVPGVGPLPAGAGFNSEIGMYQNAIEASYAWKF